MPGAGTDRLSHRDAKKFVRDKKETLQHLGQRKIRTDGLIAKGIERLFQFFRIKSDIPGFQMFFTVFLEGKTSKRFEFFRTSLFGATGQRSKKVAHFFGRTRHPALKRVLGIALKPQKRCHFGSECQYPHHQGSIIKLSGIRTLVARPGDIRLVHLLPKGSVFTKHHEGNVGRRLQRKPPAVQ